MPLSKVDSIQSTNRKGPLPVYISSGDHENAVIVLQEWWGVNKQIKGLAEQWFSDKFIAFVPDLYRGKVATNHEEADHYCSDLDWPGAVQDIQASVDYLKSKGIKNVGVVGFCVGGALALASAVSVNGIQAAVAFYGAPKDKYNIGDAGLAKVPVQCHFGTEDEIVDFSDPPAQQRLENTLKTHKACYEFYRYEGAAHGFANEENASYNDSMAKLAHSRTLEFYKKYFKN